MEREDKEIIRLSSEIKLLKLEVKCLEASTSDLMYLQYASSKELERRGYYLD